MDNLDVCYVGQFSDYVGYAEAARNIVQALVSAGVNVTTRRQTHTKEVADFGQTFTTAMERENKDIPYKIKIIHITSDGYLNHLEPLKYHIGHLFWETDGMDKLWAWNCNLMDEIWTGDYYHKEALAKAGIKRPIYVFPQPVDSEMEPRRPYRIGGHEGFLFYSIFQWIERKNPKALVMAYLKEFEGTKDVSLAIKAYRFGFGEEQKMAIRNEVRQWVIESGVSNPPRIGLLLNLMDREQVMRFHCTGDALVSSNRGEGWSIPTAEALVFGKPVVSTNCGGIYEYLDAKTMIPVKWRKIPVFGMDFAPWYNSSQSWADVDERDLRRAMRWVYEHRGEASRVGARGQELVKNKLSYRAVGELMANRIRDIYRTL